MKTTLFLSLMWALCLGACEYSDCRISPNPETGDPSEFFGRRLDCSAVICTANLVGIGVDVVDSDGAAVILDSFVVTDRAGNRIRPATSWGAAPNGNGHYTVLNDAWVSGHQGLGSYFYAKGFRGGTMVFNEVYKISADCCHVSKISGKDRIIVP